MKFEQLNIIPEILKALKEEGYTTPTEIQERAIPKVLTGQDLLGCAQTGTGKTAAFAVPTLQILNAERASSSRADGKKIRALVI
ncbi:MAG: DEAD/DEAH box helicase, partial [Clostridia bacterium]